MKKIATILISLILINSLAACSSQQPGTSARSAKPDITSAAGPDTEASTEPDIEASTDPDSKAPSSETTGQVPREAAGNGAAGPKTLVVFFSATGNTEKAADYIAEAANADIFQLEPAEAYSAADLNWRDDNSRVAKEHDNPEAREVSLVADTVPDWESYDTVFIGYPIWWGIAAWPVDSFIKANDFTGKTVVPFCTSSSSGLGESGKLLAELAGTGNWLEGMRFNSGVSEAAVQEWVQGLGL